MYLFSRVQETKLDLKRKTDADCFQVGFHHHFKKSLHVTLKLSSSVLFKLISEILHFTPISIILDLQYYHCLSYAKVEHLSHY